jgi:hypothetical protein
MRTLQSASDCSGGKTSHRRGAEAVAAGCAEADVARTALLTVVNVVKGCPETSEKSFRNLSE